MIVAEFVISHWFLTFQDWLIFHVCPSRLYGEQSFKGAGYFHTSLHTSLHNYHTMG